MSSQSGQRLWRLGLKLVKANPFSFALYCCSSASLATAVDPKASDELGYSQLLALGALQALQED